MSRLGKIVETRDKRVELLRFYSDKGYSIEVAGERCGIKSATAKKYAKMFGIAFHDYKPRLI